MQYDFLVLSILTWIPAVVLLILRPDLKKISLRLCGFSIPFAFTEIFFYPHYWEPHFIGDLGNRLGFGVEDFIFVTGLAAFTSIVYPVVHRKTLDSNKIGWIRATQLGLLGAALLGLLLLAQVPILYAALAVTGLLTARMVYLRRDLFKPASLGGLWSMFVYFGICLVFGQFFIFFFFNHYLFTNFVFIGNLAEALYKASLATSSLTPSISNIILPGFTLQA